MNIRRVIAFLLAMALLAAGAAFAESETPTIETEVAEIEKYGNLLLAVSTDGLLSQGYEYGDVVTVTVEGQSMDMPLGSQYSDVDINSLICRASNNPSQDWNKVTVAINMGNLAASMGIAEKTEIDGEPGYRWDYKVDTPVTVTLSMKEKGGYANEYMIHELVRSNERSDYPDLTDEQYANFRNVATTGMGSWALFRSSSPVNPKLNRNREADEALNNAGVRTVMNLVDTEAAMKAFDGYSLSYYSQRDIIALSLDMDFASDGFEAGLKQGFEFFAAHEGPYLVHCYEGKDRAGFVSAMLECLMGASAEEVVADYMVTFYNYYGVKPGTEQYDLIRQGNIEKILARAFGIESIYQADLAQCAEQYMLSIGLSEDTIAALKANLGRAYDQ